MICWFRMKNEANESANVDLYLSHRRATEAQASLRKRRHIIAFTAPIQKYNVHEGLKIKIALDTSRWAFKGIPKSHLLTQATRVRLNIAVTLYCVPAYLYQGYPLYKFTIESECLGNAFYLSIYLKNWCVKCMREQLCVEGIKFEAVDLQ